MYDSNVSNHGARVRAIYYAKGLEKKVDIRSPDSLGGRGSNEFLSISPQGKTPVFIESEGECEGYGIIESSAIARYVIDKYQSIAPNFIPSSAMARALSDQIVNIHDCYISNIQGCMYKSKFKFVGTRLEAIHEIHRQFSIIEKLIESYSQQNPSIQVGPYLCGKEISLADVSIFPTLVFTQFMLPTFFGFKNGGFESCCSSRMASYYQFMTKENSIGKRIADEILTTLKEWEASGRWIPILEEMNPSKLNNNNDDDDDNNYDYDDEFILLDDPFFAQVDQEHQSA